MGAWIGSFLWCVPVVCPRGLAGYLLLLILFVPLYRPRAGIIQRTTSHVYCVPYQVCSYQYAPGTYLLYMFEEQLEYGLSFEIDFSRGQSWVLSFFFRVGLGRDLILSGLKCPQNSSVQAWCDGVKRSRVPRAMIRGV